MCCKIFSLAAAVAAIAVASSAYASEWNYGCKGALPVFDDGEAIFFNRESLVLLPRSWLKGTLRDFVVRDPTSDVVAIAKARDENSGLVQTMLFTLLDHPDQKLTLTETSSKTISDIRENLVSPRTRRGQQRRKKQNASGIGVWLRQGQKPLCQRCRDGVCFRLNAI